MSKPTNLLPSIRYAVVATLIMIFCYLLTTLGYLGDNPVGRSGSYEEPLVVPAGYAFSIWGIIYLGILVFPVYSFFRRPSGSPLWKKVHQWFSINVVCNGLWLVCASYDWLWISVVIISIMLWSLYRIYDLLIQLEKDGERPAFWTEKVVFSIYFAWITLATALNIASALDFYQWDGWGIDPITWSVIILLTAAGITAWVSWKYRDAFYAGVVIWAFIALVVRHWTDHPVLGYLSLLITVIFIGLVFFYAFKKTPKHHQI